MPSVAVRCNDPALRLKLQRWVADQQLDPPRSLTLDVWRGEPPSVVDRRLPFRQPELTIRGGPPEGGVRLWWGRAPALAEIPEGSRTAGVALSDQAAERFDECAGTFLPVVLLFLLRRSGWHHVHAASAVDQLGTGWLLAGNARAGKSTTAALLAGAGWRVGGDDAAFLARRGDRIVAHVPRSPIALRSDAVRMLADQLPGVPGGGGGGGGGGGLAMGDFWPEELGGTWTPCVDPGVVLFTNTRRGSRLTYATPLTAREATAELVRWSAWVMLEPELAQEHLDLMAQLAQQARCFRVALGRDLVHEPGRLAQVVR